MNWTVVAGKEFEPEYSALPEKVQDAIQSMVRLLEQLGPQLGRPHADTLKASRYANMKELRCTAADGVWRIAYAFDPERKAILLIAGDKSGGSERRFYKELIRKADQRFYDHLDRIRKERT